MQPPKPELPPEQMTLAGMQALANQRMFDACDFAEANPLSGTAARKAAQACVCADRGHVASEHKRLILVAISHGSKILEEAADHHGIEMPKNYHKRGNWWLLQIGPRFEHAARQFERAAQASRIHSKLLRRSLKRYGDHGVNISGIGRMHFPERVKYILRELCRLVNLHNRCGEAARPPRVHRQTMWQLARAICLRDGTGFYGFQVDPARDAKILKTRKFI